MISIRKKQKLASDADLYRSRMKKPELKVGEYLPGIKKAKDRFKEVKGKLSEVADILRMARSGGEVAAIRRESVDKFQRTSEADIKWLKEEPVGPSYRFDDEGRYIRQTPTTENARPGYKGGSLGGRIKGGGSGMDATEWAGMYEDWNKGLDNLDIAKNNISVAKENVERAKKADHRNMLKWRYAQRRFTINQSKKYGTAQTTSTGTRGMRVPLTISGTGSGLRV